MEVKCPNCRAQKSPWGVKEGRKLTCQFCWHGQLGEWIYKEADA